MVIPKFPRMQFSVPIKEKITLLKRQGVSARHSLVWMHQIQLHPVIAFFLGSVATVVFIAIPLIAYLWLRSLPNPTLLTVRDLDVTTKVFDRNGALLYEIYADQNRTPLALNEIPKFVIQATIAIEDKNFYSHQGFSLSGITRAARETMLRGRVQGGSTITQQLIKSALLTPQVTISRKIKEIVLAFWAERLYTKNQILEMYLNQVPYGGTAWGIESAAQTYFGKSAKLLTLAEASLLAGLPCRPKRILTIRDSHRPGIFPPGRGA